MTAPADFVTPDELAAFAAGDADTLVEQVQATIRSYCGWHIAGTLTETITIDGSGSYDFWLPTMYLTAVELIVNEGTEVDPELYDWSADGWVVTRDRGLRWTDRPRQIQATITHGYGQAPADVQSVASAVAARAASSPDGTTREQAGAVSKAYGTYNGVSGGIALLQHERDILDRYKLPPRP